MSIKFHYEVETKRNLQNNKFSIAYFANSDLLCARDKALDYAENYLEILQKENQLGLDIKHTSPRNIAQYRYDMKNPQNAHQGLQFFFSAKVTFKNPTLKKGIKVYLVIDEDFNTGKEILHAKQRILVYQIGVYSQLQFAEMFHGLVLEHLLHRFYDSCVNRNSETINLLPYWYMLDSNKIETPETTILKTPCRLPYTFFEKTLSVYNQNVYSHEQIKKTYIEDLEYDFSTIKDSRLKKLEKEITAFHYTNGGLILIPYNNQNQAENPAENLKQIIRLLNTKEPRNNTFHNRFNCIITQDKKGVLYLVILVHRLKSASEMSNLIIPEKIYFKEFGKTQKITDLFFICAYLERNFIIDEDY